MSAIVTLITFQKVSSRIRRQSPMGKHTRLISWKGRQEIRYELLTWFLRNSCTDISNNWAFWRPIPQKVRYLRKTWEQQTDDSPQLARFAEEVRRGQRQRERERETEGGRAYLDKDRNLFKRGQWPCPAAAQRSAARSARRRRRGQSKRIPLSAGSFTKAKPHRPNVKVVPARRD